MRLPERIACLLARRNICEHCLLSGRVAEEKEDRRILLRKKNPSTYAAEFCTAFLRIRMGVDRNDTCEYLAVYGRGV